MRKYSSTDDYDERVPEPNGGNRWRSLLKNTSAVAAAGVVGVAVFAGYRFRVAKPSQYVVRTGWLIDKVAVDKKAFQMPFQTYKMISVEPNNYKFDLQAMSKEKMEFILPGVYTIGPKVTNSTKRICIIY